MAGPIPAASPIPVASPIPAASTPNHAPATVALPRRWLVPELRWRAIAYYSTAAMQGAFGLVKAFIYAKLLGSEALGYYALGVLFSSYWQTCAQVGLCRGLECYLPPAYGAGDVGDAQRTRNRVAGALLVVTVCLLPVYSAACLLLPTSSMLAKTVFLLAGWLSTANLFSGLPILDLRSRGCILQFGSLGCLRTVGNLMLGVAGAVWFGAIGALAGETLVALLLFAWGSQFACPGFRFDFVSLRELRHIFALGIPLTLRNLANAFCQTMDRWCVTAALGVLAFGQYAFAMFVVTAGWLTYTAIWFHLGPRAAQLYGRSGDLGAAFRTLRTSALRLALLLAVTWLPFKLAVELLVEAWFPEYRVGGGVMSILYWGTVFQLLCLFDWIPMIARRTLPLLWLTLATTLLTGALYAVAVLERWPLAVFAWIFVFGRALVAAGQWLIAAWMVRHSEPKLT